jgi:phosphoribosylformylglycinamidine cyclo-ligase
LIEPHAVVLGGSAVGNVEKSQLLLGSNLQAGDVMLAAGATGIHANGLSLARKLAAELPQGYATPVPGDPRGRGFGEVLLDPAPLYGPLLEALQSGGIELHYAVHVTGHGWRKLMRAAQDFSYVVERIPEAPPVLRYISELARMDNAEAYGTFNMGIGYVFFVPERDRARACSIAAQRGQALLAIGHVESGPKSVRVAPLELVFSGTSLQIR